MKVENGKFFYVIMKNKNPQRIKKVIPEKLIKVK